MRGRARVRVRVRVRVCVCARARVRVCNICTAMGSNTQNGTISLSKLNRFC